MEAGGLTVAITGPTGDIGRPLLAALERTDGVAQVRGMARGAFDPSALELRKVEFVQGDIMDRAAVQRLVEGADVLVHLAFVVFGGHAETWSVNIEGTRNVFEVAAAANVKKMVYTSSVAAYGFHRDSALPLSEDAPLRPSRGYDYSEQKAQSEELLGEIIGSRIPSYVFRPCIVAGAQSLALVDDNPYMRIGARLPGWLLRGLSRISWLKPIVPDAKQPIQLVHADDLADALVAAILGRGKPGAYNIAGPGELSLTRMAQEFGWYPVRIPRSVARASAGGLGRLPAVPAEIQFFSNLLQSSVVVNCSKAASELQWHPRRSAEEILIETVAAARARDRH